MDIANILLFCLMSLIIGAVLMLLVQYYAFVRYCDLPEETLEQKLFNEKYSLPENLKASAKNADPESKYPLVAVNLIMQFLFHELKNAHRVRKWFYRKLSLELDELLTKTTTGRLFDKLTIRDLDLGKEFPEIKNLRVHNAELSDGEGRIESLDLLLELHYKGNFRLSVDADMVLGKKGSLTLKVQALCGIARLQFTRKPYTHWSLSFLGDPQLELGIESQIQGRQMQSNITSLISNQIRKAIRRKHTLPNYKLRYKPFFHKVEEDVECDIHPNGRLEVKVSELSRLLVPSHVTDVYCTLTMASHVWVEARQKDDRNVIISLDVEIHKAKNQQIGIVFKQAEGVVQVEAILPNTPAIKANLRAGDTLVSIEGKKANTIQQVAKLIKALQKSVFALRIERIVPGIIRNDAILEDLDVYEDLGDANGCFTKSSESIMAKPSRKNSATSSESSLSNTPTHSPRKSKIIAKVLSKCKETAEATAPSTPEPKATADDSSAPDSEHEGVEYYQQHSTIDCKVRSDIIMDDLSKFKLDDRCCFLNVCVYGKSIGSSDLLGYVNIPVAATLAECSETNLGNMIKIYSLIPPTTQDLLSYPMSGQSGFDPSLCYGDLLLSFTWTGDVAISPSDNKKKLKAKTSIDKLDSELEKSAEVSAIKSHDFIRTHFHRATQCDFCGKKIWLKDAVQCKDCAMCCHKKCVKKCQDSTVCGPVDCTSYSPLTTGSQVSQPEVIFTEVPSMKSDASEDDEEAAKNKLDTGHRQSLGGLLAQGLKRVNSANNLSIPGIASPFGNNSKSLPPSPQHSPRKQSLANLHGDPFVVVTQRLEAIPDDSNVLGDEQIAAITEPLVGISKEEDIMSMAKDSSKTLYVELEANERVDKINILLSKLRIALDSETSTHSNLLSANTPTVSNKVEHGQPPQSTEIATGSPAREKSSVPNEKVDIETTRRSFLVAQSEERVQALSVIMLYLCTGLQHAQGVACQ